MTRFLVVVLTLVTPTLVLASEPGERLTWDDLGLELPRLRAESFLAPLEPTACHELETPNALQCGRSFPHEPMDADGNLYFSIDAGEGREIWRTRPDGRTELVVTIPGKREGPFGTIDLATFGGFYIDLVHGFLYLRLTTDCSPQASCEYSVAHEIIRIRGLPRLHKPTGLR